MDREPIDAQELDERIRDVPFDDYFALMELLVLAHHLLAREDHDDAKILFNAVDRLADLLARLASDDVEN